MPVAFVILRSEAIVTADELIAFAKSKLARFKAPKRVVFAERPKTSTGKLQKFRLLGEVAAASPADAPT